MRTLIPGSADEEYTTSDKELILGLLILKHKPVRVEVDSNKDFPIIHYTFDRNMAEDDINRLLSNDDIAVDIKDVWAAQRVWAMNIRRAKRA